MTLLSLLLPAWETCSPRVGVPDLLVTGARPDVGGQLGAGGEGLAQALAPDPALGLIDLARQVQVKTSQHAQGRSVLI